METGTSVRRGRPLVEHEGTAAGRGFQSPLEEGFILPLREDFLLEREEGLG